MSSFATQSSTPSAILPSWAAPIIGRVVAHRGGHALHTALGTALLEQRDAWAYVEAPQAASAAVGVPVTVAG